MEGVDYAFSRPPVSALVAAGKRFAVRYGGVGTSNKWLTADEAKTLSRAGIALVANVEGAASGLLGGYQAGVEWASRANRHFLACGMGVDRPIYLSVDFDVQPAGWPAVADALRGAAAVIGADRVGVYGGRNAIRWARRDGVARWFWQTYAWSGSPTQWIAGNHLEQYRNGVTIGGAACDLNRSLVSDFGQWGVGMELDSRIRAPYPHANDSVEAALGFIWANGEGLHKKADDLAASVSGLRQEVGEIQTPEVRPSDGDLMHLAQLLEPALERAVENVLARTALVVRPGV